MTVRSPRLTIGIPTLRRRAYLEEAVRSALAQASDGIEVLISQDVQANGTRDPDIAAWATREANADTRVRYVCVEQRPLGLAGNWNRIVELAAGEFVTIIGDDDRLLPGFAAALLAHAGTADVIFGNHHIIDSTGTRLDDATARATARFQRDRLMPGPQAVGAECVWRNSVPMSASIIRTSLARRLRFAEDINTPDIEFFARAAAEAARFHFVAALVAEYRVHAQSATTGGLTLARLAERLSPIAVPAAVAPIKAERLREFSDGAIRAALLRGDVDALRESLALGCGSSFTSRIVGLAADLPAGSGAALRAASALFRMARRAAGRP